MITLVIVKNPFSPQDGREVKYIEATSLAELKEEYKMPGVYLLSTVNGYSIEGDKELSDGDFVVLYPAIEKGGKGGKGILGILAAVVLSVVSFGVGGLVATGVWGSFAGASAMAAMGGYLAAAAIMFLGSSLIARMNGQNVDTGSYGNNDPTYSWGAVQTMEGQNNSVALTYGLVKSGGQTIGKYTMASGDDDYLYWLVAAGEGEVEITDIKLNDNPIGLYKDVEYQTRRGTNNQSVITFFGDTHFTQTLSYNMETLNTWYESAAQGTATEGLIVKIECPNGLFHGTDSGNLETNTVYVQIQLHGSDGVWHDVTDFVHTTDDWDSTKQAYAISGKATKAIRREYRVDRIDPDEYTVRVRVIERKYSDTTRDGFTTYWTGVSSIVYDDFIYPCTALLGIKAKATDQLSGAPALTFKKWRSVVYVYENGAYTAKNADNPAWACYDVLHQCRALINVNTGNTNYEVRGVPVNLIRYDDFAAWAAFCEEKNYYVNIEINTVGELIDVCNQKIAPIGHGRVLRFGTKYGCIYAHEQEPVQMFGMGNIKAGTFREEFLKIADRANCVEVAFTNAAADYQRDVITIYSDTYNTDGYAKTAQVTMDGCTKYSQAYREGVYQLQCNKYQLRTVTFEADIDAIACTVGDVVIIAHDVPQWQNSGRVESVTGNQVVLPCVVADQSATYLLQWRASATDTLYEHSCTFVETENDYTTFEIAYEQGETAVYPTAGDVFSIAESATENKLFTIQNITRAQDFTRQISCIEYDERVFTEPENYDGDDEKEKVFNVTISQGAHQTVTVTKYKGVQSQTYTESFTETETGWSINVSVASEAGYAYGNVVINGMEYSSNIPTLALNKNYYITVKEAEVGMVVYINGTVASWWGYVFYQESSCTNAVYKNDIVGKIIIKDMSIDGLPFWGDSIVGNNEPGSYRQYCANATTVDVSDIDMSRKTSMDTCFKGCTYLRNVIGLNNWNPVDVESCKGMFADCNRLVNIGNISNWQMPALRNASDMFSRTALPCIDLHNWYTPNLESTRQMFAYNTNLEVLDVSGLDTRNATDMYNMFATNYYSPTGTVSAFKYLIIDSTELKLEMKEDISSLPKFPRTTKILVPRSKLEDYKAWGYWSSRAEQFDAIENYNIIRSNGQITVVPIGDQT